MFYIIRGHGFVNEIQTITQVFYPNEKFIRVDEISDIGVTAVSGLFGGRCISEIFHNNEPVSRYETPLVGEAGHCVKKSMFGCLVKAQGYTPDWGLLTGIRPSKLIHMLRGHGLSDDEIIRHFSDEFFVSRLKSELSLRVANAESKILAQLFGKYSVYIGIPFCPSRCLYCSFTSQPIGKCPDIVDDYLAALEKELFYTLRYLHGEAPDAIYIGGGTPTVLSASRLERLLIAVGRAFPKRTEYTVEAGRPDTIDRDKLRLLKAHGVTRLSINPQTMNDKTLALIGRGHTGREFLEAFEMARAEGHQNINIDLILGLPGEDENVVKNSLETVLPLRPENLTAHTLAVKRASRLKEEMHLHVGATQAAECRPCGGGRYNRVENMIKATEIAAYSAGMHPYYMYRQKNMLGNFENVGYTLPGSDCIYNVMIMTERQSILALGAGAITKIVDSGHISRIFNVKSAKDYIDRIDEMIKRKKRMVLWV